MTADRRLAKALVLSRAALERKGADLVVIHVGPESSIAEYLVICSGSSDRQVQSIAEGMARALKDHGDPPRSIEGARHGHWVLLDCDDVVGHVFYRPAREFYDLERLWQHAPRVELPEPLRSQALGFRTDAASA